MDERSGKFSRPRSEADADAWEELAMERNARASDREADLDLREIQIDEDEARALDRDERVDEILAAADERDDRAEIRDEAADEREHADSLHSFLQNPEYNATLKARRAAATDRSHSKTDRTAGATDRANLTGRPTKAADQESQD